MTRLLPLLLTLAVALGGVTAQPASAAKPKTAAERFQVEPAPRGAAWGAVLIDWETGETLYERGGRRRLDPASTTKVLTALLALEQGDLNAKVTVSRRAARTPGSAMYIREGEVYSLHDLLHGLLLRSGNDAATAIAEHLSGSVESFATLMTRRAKELGATGSNFVNPHGLTHPNHFSTAYDLAVITRAAFANPIFAEIVALPSKELTYEEVERQVLLHNTNRLLHQLPGADGVKTGTTAAAGPCLIASATRGEQKLIAVVLHAGNRWREAADLLEWGFRNFRIAHLGQEGEVLMALPVEGGKRTFVPVVFQSDLTLLLPRKEGPLPQLSVRLPQSVTAPIDKGALLGSVTVEGVGAPGEPVPLVAADAVQQATWLDQMGSGLQRLLQFLIDQNPLGL